MVGLYNFDIDVQTSSCSHSGLHVVHIKLEPANVMALFKMLGGGEVIERKYLL